MIISTKGRYALRVIIDLAEQQAEGYIPLKDIAKRQNISQKYLESIMTVFSKNGFVEAMHGKGGGYRLNRPLNEYKVGSILRVVEGNLTPVSCKECIGEACEKASNCRTLPMWKKLNTMINDYLDDITVEDLMNNVCYANDI